MKEEILPSEKEVLNAIIEQLFKKYDALEEINKQQVIEIARLNKENEKLRKNIYQAIIELDCMKSDVYYEDYDIKDEFYIKLMRALGEEE